RGERLGAAAPRDAGAERDRRARSRNGPRSDDRGLARPQLRPRLLARRLGDRVRVHDRRHVRDLPPAVRGREILARHLRAGRGPPPDLPAAPAAVTTEGSTRAGAGPADPSPTPLAPAGTTPPPPP